MKIKRTEVPVWSRWPVCSTRMLLPCIAISGFWGQPMMLAFAFWKWRVYFHILPGACKVDASEEVAS